MINFRFLRFTFFVAVTLVSIYKLGFAGWLAEQSLWIWGSALAVVAILLLLRSIMTMREAPAWFGLAWFAGGLGATFGAGYLAWYAWTHPAFHNWYLIPVFGALALAAIFVFWIPFLSSFSKKSRVLNRLEDAIEAGNPEAEGVLGEARGLIGMGESLEQLHLDILEGKLRYTQGLLEAALVPLERAVGNALDNNDPRVGCEAASWLVKALRALGREAEAEDWVEEVGCAWGESLDPENSSESAQQAA